MVISILPKIAFNSLYKKKKLVFIWAPFRASICPHAGSPSHRLAALLRYGFLPFGTKELPLRIAGANGLLRQGHKGFSSFSAFSAEKNRSEAKPGVARPGAQIKILLCCS
ncbi:MAG: hypothetical protein H0W73_10485 [Bacteroidetes bacterium]|nr:hypothetical protein [Bacteroidota bacterium]